jgi:hypothetical protein
MKIDFAIDTWPVGSRHFSFRTYTQHSFREIDISLWKFQLLVSITARTAPSDINQVAA